MAGNSDYLILVSAVCATNSYFDCASTFEPITAAQYNRFSPHISEAVKRDKCLYCNSEFFDARYHPGTCANCGAPKGK